MNNCLEFTLVMALAFTTSAHADFNIFEAGNSAAFAPGPQFGGLSPTQGSTYFIAPGAGTESGFQLAGGPFKDSIINGAGELIGPDLSGDGLIVSTDTVIDNGSNNFDLILRIATTVGGNIAPTGIIGDSGVELTTLGLFVGGGLNPVDLDKPIFANTAQIEVFNTANKSIGTIDVLGLGNFTAGKEGGWDGTLGLDFGSQIQIGDVGAVELQINYDTVAIPEPACAAVFALIGLGIVTRRRR